MINLPVALSSLMQRHLQLSLPQESGAQQGQPVLQQEQAQVRQPGHRRTQATMVGWQLLFISKVG